MEIKIKELKGRKVIAVTGDIDMYTSPRLRTELMNLVQKKIPVLVIDFKDVSYIDSSGIATFVEGLKGMKSYSGSLRLSHIPNGIMEIFRFSKLDRVFDIYKKTEDAVNI